MIRREWTDAQAMRAAHPATFEAPSEDYVLAVRVGYYVKLAFVRGGARERVWARVTAIEPEPPGASPYERVFHGALVIESIQRPDLFPTDAEIECEGRHLYDICDPETADREELAEIAGMTPAPAV